MEPLPLIIISDIHLSADEKLDDFTSDEEFADLLHFFREKEENYHLIINGDFIDFLQMDPKSPESRKRTVIPRPYPLNENEKDAVSMLKACAKRHPLVFDAIKDFLSKDGNRVSILKGNHDPEFSWPLVQEEMRILVECTDKDRLNFLERGIFFEERGIYIEHGNQFDPWNSFNNIKAPFQNRSANRINFPIGSVFVRVFWNRVEPLFPFIDKVRPMTDSGIAVIVRHPTFLLFHFDYLFDLFLSLLKRDILSLFAHSNEDEEVDPIENLLIGFEKRSTFSRYLLFLFSFMFLYLLSRILMQVYVASGFTILSATKYVLTRWGPFLLASTGGLLLLLIGKFIPHLLNIIGFSSRSIHPIYRIWVFFSTIIFFGFLLRVLWIPVLIFFLFYIIKDGLYSTAPRRRVGDLIFDRPLTNEIEAAIALIRERGIKTVIFGHTHIPLVIEVPGGARYINSGTWIKTILLREIRERQVALHPFVLIDKEGNPNLLSWRGTVTTKRILY